LATRLRSPKERPKERQCKILDIPTEKMVTVKKDAKQEQDWWLRQARDPEQQVEWLRQNNLIYGGLIVVGVYMVQPFLTATSLDLSAKICVVAFSVAIPLLAALVLVNSQEAFRRRATKSRIVAITKAVAQASAFAGLVAAFWHILWIAGVGILAGGIVAAGVHSAGYVRLELDGPTSDEAEEPDDSES
jgi:hypothetical protein